MPRVRLGVAVLVPAPLATEVDALRRALGDPALGRIAPHITLVPPVNVPVDHLDDALAVLREAAAATGPLRLRIGPATTFHPVTPVVYLAVGGDVDGLRALRDAVFRPPLERTLTHGFVPHVTVADDLDPERIPAAVATLADFVVDVTVDRVHLLRQDSGRVWRPIADARFAAPAVIGRGGLPVTVEVAERLPPDAGALLAAAGEAAPGPARTETPTTGGAAGPAATAIAASAGNAATAGVGARAADGPGPSGSARTAVAAGTPGSGPAPGVAGASGAFGVAGVAGVVDVAVVARRGDELAGVATAVAVGPVGRMTAIVVAPGARRQGVGRHVLTALADALRDHGCTVLEAVAPAHPAPDALFGGAGWHAAGDLTVPVPAVAPPATAAANALESPGPSTSGAGDPGASTVWRRWERRPPTPPPPA